MKLGKQIPLSLPLSREKPWLNSPLLDKGGDGGGFAYASPEFKIYPLTATHAKHHHQSKRTSTQRDQTLRHAKNGTLWTIQSKMTDTGWETRCWQRYRHALNHPYGPQTRRMLQRRETPRTYRQKFTSCKEIFTKLWNSSRKTYKNNLLRWISSWGARIFLPRSRNMRQCGLLQVSPSERNCVSVDFTGQKEWINR